MMNGPIDPLDPGPFDAARSAKVRLEHAHGQAEVIKQLASGVAVHFGDQSLFIPGGDPQALLKVIETKTLELACAYTAWEYAAQQAEREEMT